MRDLLVQPHLHPQSRGRNGSVLGGRHIRSDLRENQPGVPVIDGQFIKPIPNLYRDVWNCNATGVHLGFVANGIGNTADASTRRSCAAYVRPHCNFSVHEGIRSSLSRAKILTLCNAAPERTTIFVHDNARGDIQQEVLLNEFRTSLAERCSKLRWYLNIQLSTLIVGIITQWPA